VHKWGKKFGAGVTQTEDFFALHAMQGKDTFESIFPDLFPDLKIYYDNYCCNYKNHLGI